MSFKYELPSLDSLKEKHVRYCTDVYGQAKNILASLTPEIVKCAATLQDTVQLSLNMEPYLSQMVIEYVPVVIKVISTVMAEHQYQFKIDGSQLILTFEFNKDVQPEPQQQ